MSYPALRLDNAGDALIVEVQGEAITLRTSKPFAPGSPVSGVLDNAHSLRLKTHRCRKEDRADGFEFTLDGRIVDMTKTLRAVLSSPAS